MPHPTLDPTPPTDNDHVVLYGHPASRVARNVWMLQELQVPFHNEITPFFSDHYDQLNPNRKVPFLQITPSHNDDDQHTITLYESMAINVYLLRRYASRSSLAPTTTKEWSQLYKWSLWSMTELDMLLFEGLMHVLSQPNNYSGYFDRTKSHARYERVLRELKFPLHVLDRALQDNKTGWMYGDAFSAIDLNVGSVAYWILLQPDPTRVLQDVPFVAAWLQRLRQRACFPLNELRKGKHQQVVKNMWAGKALQENAQQRVGRAGGTSFAKM